MMKAIVVVIGLTLVMLAPSAFAMKCYSTGKNLEKEAGKMEVRNGSNHTIHFFVYTGTRDSCPSASDPNQEVQYESVGKGSSKYASVTGTQDNKYIIVCNKDYAYRCSIPFDDQRKLKICADDEVLNDEGKCDTDTPFYIMNEQRVFVRTDV